MEDKREKRKAYMKEWREKNKEKVKKYKEEHKGKRKEYMKEYSKKYSKENREKFVEYNNKWKENNKEKAKDIMIRGNLKASKDRITCECGRNIRRDGLERHLKRNIHDKRLHEKLISKKPI